MIPTIDDLARRFVGVDVQHRRFGTDWPDPWRAQLLVNKNQRSDYRLIRFGATRAEAECALIDAVLEIDRAGKQPPIERLRFGAWKNGGEQ